MNIVFILNGNSHLLVDNKTSTKNILLDYKSVKFRVFCICLLKSKRFLCVILVCIFCLVFIGCPNCAIEKSNVNFCYNRMDIYISLRLLITRLGEIAHSEVFVNWI